MKTPLIAAVSTAALVVFALAGCAPASTPAESAGPTTAPLEGDVTVFAAASLTDSFATIAAAFEDENPGVKVVFNFGGSSGLAEQIVAGAPADVFAAASPATMTTVTDASFSIDPVNFATNTLEIAVPAGNPGGVTGLADFGKKDLAIAVCAVEVPCGAASAKIFDATGITPDVDTYEQDVKAVLSKVELGEVDAGLVYVTDVQAAGDGVEGVEFAEAADAVNDYPIAALTEAPNPDAAAAFAAFVLTDASQKTLQDAGFGAP